MNESKPENYRQDHVIRFGVSHLSFHIYLGVYKVMFPVLNSSRICDLSINEQINKVLVFYHSAPNNNYIFCNR